MGRARDRGQLLNDVVEVALGSGLVDQSLRAIADACGTSHRMLIHYFGSKEGLFVEVVRAVEARQRVQLEALFMSGEGSNDVGQRFWEQLRLPALARQERLFFEIYGQALQGRKWATPLLDGIVDDWLHPLAAMFRSAGVDEERAHTIGRLCVAVSRGLLLDVLATNAEHDVDAAMQHFLKMVAIYLRGEVGVEL